MAVILENKPLDYNLLSRLLYEIYDTLISCEKYMLDIDKFMFAPELVYLSPDYSNIALCYYPLKDEDINVSLRNLFDYLLKHINHHDERCVYITYSLHNHCLKDSFSPNILMSYLSSEQSKASPSTPTSLPIERKPVPSFSTTNISHYGQNNINADTPEKSIPKDLFFRVGILGSVFLIGTSCLGGYNIYKNMEGPITSLLNKDKTPSDIPSFYINDIEDSGNTILLSTPENNNIHTLIYTGADMNSKIEITHYPFTIGKSSDCDFTIQNPIISRLHGRITCGVDDLNIPTYYIEDLNSTNGTFLNNLSITPYQKYPITIGDNISFGHLTYIFR